MKAKSKFIIGDIQGCYKEFKNLIKLIDPNKENKFFCVGDLVNRGPESEKVLDYVLENNNHDEIQIACYDYSKTFGTDHLRVGIRLIDYREFLRNEAY